MFVINQMIKKSEKVIPLIKICRNFLPVILHHLCSLFTNKGVYESHKKILVKLRNGLSFYVRSRGDIGIMIDMFSSNIYRFPGEVDTVIDIGAHIGLFTCYASRFAKRIIAIEPNPDNFALLNENLKLNNINNVVLLNAAVSDREGSQTLYLSNSGTQEHSLLPFDTERTIRVKVITLSHIFKRYNLDRVDFLKVDCEGCEKSVLESSSDILKKIDMISIDSHHGFTEDIISILRRSGFTVFKVGDIIHGRRKKEAIGCIALYGISVNRSI